MTAVREGLAVWQTKIGEYRIFETDTTTPLVARQLAMLKGGTSMMVTLSELQWAKIRACIEVMTKSELDSAIEAGTVGEIFAAAAFPDSRRPPRLGENLVQESIRVWRHLARP